MARKQRNNIDYFPHDVRHGKKMFYIREQHGNDGYAIWFILLEELGKAEMHYLDLTDEVELLYLSSQMKVTKDKLVNIINDMSKLGVFVSDLWQEEKILFSMKFVEDISDAYKKRVNDCVANPYELIEFLRSIGRKIGDGLTDKYSKIHQSGHGSTQSKVKKNKVDKSKVDYSKEEKIRLENSVILSRLSEFLKSKLGYRLPSKFFNDSEELYSKAEISINHTLKEYGKEATGDIVFIVLVEVIKNSKFYKDKKYFSIEKLNEYWDSNWSEYKTKFSKFAKNKFDKQPA